MKEKEKSLFDIFNRSLLKATKDIIDAVEKSNHVDKDTVANDRFKQHEILDRVYLIQDMFTRYVEDNEDVVQAFDLIRTVADMAEKEAKKKPTED